MLRASCGDSVPIAVDHEDVPEHALAEDFPHEFEAVLSGRSEQVEHQVAVDADPTEVHRDRGFPLAGAGLVADAALGGQHGDLADRADQCRLAGRERPGDDDLDGFPPTAATQRGASRVNAMPWLTAPAHRR